MQQSLLGNRAVRPEDENKKRQAADSLDPTSKRLRMSMDGDGTPTPSVMSVPPLPEGPVPLSTIFNLANDNALSTFDIQQLPHDLVNRIVLASLIAVQSEKMSSSIAVSSGSHP